MLTFKKLLLPIAISSALVACGGGGGGSSDSASSDTPSTAESTTISGAATKGIIVGGVVTVYPIVDGAVDESSPLGETTTDENGEYSIDLDSSYDGGPVIVRITPAADGSSVMKCDIPSNCGTGIEFGDDYALTDADFALEAVLSTAEDGEVSVNITPLTDIAAELAQSRLLEDDSLDPALVADVANSQVADRFDIGGGDLTAQPVVDLTDPQAVAEADENAVSYAALGAAIVTAVQEDNTDLSVEDAIEQFSENYASDGVAGNTETTGTTALDEILTATLDVFDAVETTADAADVELDLSVVATEVVTQIATAQSEEADQYDQGTPSPTAGSEELVQAKALVQDIRNLSSAVSLADIDEDGAARLEAFALEIDAAEAVSGEDSTVVLDATGMVAQAMWLASEAWEEDNTLTAYHTDDGITVNIVADVNGLTMTVDQEVTVSWWEWDYSLNESVEVLSRDVTVDLDSTLDVTGDDPGRVGEEFPNTGIWNLDDYYTSDDGAVTYTLSGSIDLTLTGTAETEAVRLTINEGIATGTIETDEIEEWEYAGTGTFLENLDFYMEREFNGELNLTDLSLVADITLEELDENPIVFNGRLDVELGLLEFSESNSGSFDGSIDFSEGTQSSSQASSYTHSGEFTTASLSLSGEFANASGDNFNAALALEANGTGVHLSESGSFSESTECSGSNCNSSASEFESGLVAEETTDVYIGFNFSLSFTSDLDGVSDALEVTLSGERTGLESAELDLAIAYDGRRIEVQATEEDNATITNQDGVVISLTDNEEENGENYLSGTIRVGDTFYATIDEREVQTIRYTDGTFESL